jgi:acyl-CoA dehydrogenase
MELLHLYGTESQKAEWLEALASGATRSCFAMTEPAVASSDATNIATTITKEGNHYVINGLKWWITGAAHPKCTFAILMGKTNPNEAPHRQHSMIVVPMSPPASRSSEPSHVWLRPRSRSSQ